MMDSRRSFFKRAAALVAGAVVAPAVLHAEPTNIPCPDVIVLDAARAWLKENARYEWIEVYERGEIMPLHVELEQVHRRLLRGEDGGYIRVRDR